jgi:hypothetical protein
MAATLEPEGFMGKKASWPYVAGRAMRWLKIETAVGAVRERQARARLGAI